MSNYAGENDDRGLVASIKQGDQQAFGKLYDKYAPSLFGIISRIVNDEKTGEEILNKVFVTAWSQAADFNASKTSFFTWLITLSRQTAFNEIRLQQQTNPLYIKPVYGEDYKTVFELLYYQGLNCSGAAAALNITVEEVKADMRAAIKNLKIKETI